MPDINHNLVIDTAAGNIYAAITTAEGLSHWFAKATVAKPEIGFVNVFIFGPYRNEMKITELIVNKKGGLVLYPFCQGMDGYKNFIRAGRKGGKDLTTFYTQ